MRLLDTKTYQITEFFDDGIPEYAILSHTWGLQELTYQDIQSVSLAREMKPQGFAKVEGACALASSEGYTYIWIDTCCIDKTSSAELSEAINSMYAWYRRSSICYAYLIDAEHCFSLAFRNSRWFTRGWTLQELIAPSEVVFYSGQWKLLGRKSHLKGLLSDITGIDISILAGADPSLITVARKMSWASCRTTTRLEDMAYCLMGLFGVSMPLIYGEGKNAFFRLQQEIIKTVDDQSIFAWTIPEDERAEQQFYGLLAEAPSAFRFTGKLVSPFATSHSSRQATRIVNNSLQTEFLIQPRTHSPYVHDDTYIRIPRGRYYLAALGCGLSSFGNVSPCIDLWSLDEDNSQFARINPWVLREVHLDPSAVSLRFKRRSNPESWLCIMTFVQRFLAHPTLWEFRVISVSQKPQEPIPIGFSIQSLKPVISIYEGLPVDRWYSNDRLLQRSYRSRYKLLQQKIHTDANMYAADRGSRSQGEEHVTRVTEGMVRVGIPATKQEDDDGSAGEEEEEEEEEEEVERSRRPPPPTRRDSTQFAALVLGVDIIYNYETQDWRRQPWCRLAQLREDAHLKEFRHVIDWQEGEASELECPSIDASLRAKVAMLPGDKLYTVQLDCVYRRETRSWWW